MLKGYYFITDSSLSKKGNVSDVKAALKAKVGVVQYRNKIANTNLMYKEAMILKKICADAMLLINDRVDIALAVNASGVHLGQEDMPYKIARSLLGKNKIIGLTVHSLKEARQAEKLGADYIAISPIFGTSTKPDAGKPVGVEMIKEIRKQVSIPIVAIGGINLSNAKRVILSGAEMLCAISTVVSKPDVAGEILRFQRFFKIEKN